MLLVESHAHRIVARGWQREHTTIGTIAIVRDVHLGDVHRAKDTQKPLEGENCNDKYSLLNHSVVSIASFVMRAILEEEETRQEETFAHKAAIGKWMTKGKSNKGENKRLKEKQIHQKNARGH